MSRRPGLLSRFFDTSEIDPESRNKFLIVGGIVAVVVVSFALILVGYYLDRVESRGGTVFVVGEREYKYDYLEARVNAAVAGGSFNFESIEMSISTVVTRIQNEELFRLVGQDMGFTVTEEELDAGMKDYLRVPQDIEHNEFARILRDELRLLGLSLSQFQDIVEGELYEDKIRAAMADELPDEVEQVQLRLILVETEEEAEAAMERIEAGEDFEDVATEESIHSTAENGGDYGWTPQGVLPEALDEAAFNLEPGEVSEIVESASGFFIWKAEAREMRELEEFDREDIVTQRLGDRLDEAVDEHGIENHLTFNQVQRIAGQIQVPGGV